MLDFDQGYIDFIKSLKSSSEDIEKSFSTINEAFLLNQIPQDIFEKAQKVYKDNAENRKLKRVGKPWGKEGQEEGKQEPSKSEEKPLEQHAKEASQGDLERTIKESGDEKLRQAAHAELERRQKEEASQEEEKKEPPSGENPEADTKKEPDTAGKDSGSGGVSGDIEFKKETQEIYNLKQKVDKVEYDYKFELNKFCKENNLTPSSVIAQMKFKQSKEGEKLNKELWGIKKELQSKVDGSKNKKVIPFYSVSLETSENSESLYQGYSKEEAEQAAKEVDSSKNSSKYSEATVLLQQKDDEFVFAGDIENDENEEDYPIEDDSSREEKYIKTSKDNGFKEVDTFSIKGSEQTAQDLDLEVRDWLNKEYGRESYKSYDSIVLGTNKDGNDVTLQIRVKDHSENPANKSKSGADHFLSIVLANKNATAQRFHSSTELYFTGDDKLNDIKEQVNEYIQNIIDGSDIVELDNKMKKAGHKLEK